MIFPHKKLILPCHKNGYLQSASDARKYRDRFKRNPLAKVADMFIPKPLRMSPGYPCCCGEDPCLGLCDSDTLLGTEWAIDVANLSASGTNCECDWNTIYDGVYISDPLEYCGTADVIYGANILNMSCNCTPNSCYPVPCNYPPQPGTCVQAAWMKFSCAINTLYVLLTICHGDPWSSLSVDFTVDLGDCLLRHYDVPIDEAVDSLGNCDSGFSASGYISVDVV